MFRSFSTASINYEPAPRNGHQAILVGSKVYMWAGVVGGLPKVHDSPEKRELVSRIEVFHTENGEWVQQPTSGAPPLGVCGYGCTAVGDDTPLLWRLLRPW